jgi:hypothetical protein
MIDLIDLRRKVDKIYEHSTSGRETAYVEVNGKLYPVADIHHRRETKAVVITVSQEDI